MSRAKQRLGTALKKTRGLSDNWFGSVEASVEELPSIQSKTKRVRKNIYIEEETADKIEGICKKHGVSFTEVANDILTKFVSGQKK